MAARTESPETGELSFGGWIWRYDLRAAGPSRTTVTLTYDWSAVPPQVREYLQFPASTSSSRRGQDNLGNSLQHLSELVARNTSRLLIRVGARRLQTLRRAVVCSAQCSRRRAAYHNFQYAVLTLIQLGERFSRPIG